ncbi:hypothetical protein RB2654_15315 [Rhodobacterales bacterium HTCC2654]|uniref:Uncharacterized protein n=1 Tax=Maritimibacter alkaliphilus HTCC2654 TaxID=314271 RepID=A3VHB2_9RHOB|nr:hypothetical protein RB2654_15315 [Rhodobacterales bacterium HTCC2654] [Maritimibacter alkaliphilus HTCC2654]
MSVAPVRKSALIVPQRVTGSSG